MSARCFATKHGAQWIGVVLIEGREYQTEACASFDEAIAAARELACCLLRDTRQLAARALGYAAAGIRWWNQLPERERLQWLERAHSAIPAEAWAAYLRSQRKEVAPTKR